MKLPPLPEPYQREVYATSHNTPSVRSGFELGGYVKTPALFTAEQLQDRDLQVARAALEEAAKLCEDEEARLWRAYKGRGKPSEKGNPYTEGASDQCAVLADAIKKIKVSHG